MAPVPSSSATLSVRLLWPFARVLSEAAGVGHLLDLSGVPREDFGNPEIRIPHEVVMHAVAESVRLTGDPLLGLRAGDQFDQLDFVTLEFAARSATCLGKAMGIISRYFRVMSEATEVRVVVEGERAIWRIRATDGVPQVPAANDFAVASSIAFSRRNAAVFMPPQEIWLMHDRPPYAAEYERRYGSRVRFGAPFNATVIDRARLDAPMRHASPELSAAFESHMRRILDKLQSQDGLHSRVRFEIGEQLRTGEATLVETARRMGTTVPALRRDLEDEGTTFDALRDGVRRELGALHLTTSSLGISEIAFLLGFSDIRSFERAFRRWTGLTPSEYRAAHRS